MALTVEEILALAYTYKLGKKILNKFLVTVVKCSTVMVVGIVVP